MLTRRGFFGRLAGAFAAALASPALLELLPAPAAPPLAVHPDAFGISMRFIRNWDAAPGDVTRFDVLFGVACRPEFACRIANDTVHRLRDDVGPARGSFAAYLEADQAVQARAAVVPCAYCIRMVGDHCRKRGCLREQYYRGALADTGFDWDPPGASL